MALEHYHLTGQHGYFMCDTRQPELPPPPVAEGPEDDKRECRNPKPRQAQPYGSHEQERTFQWNS